MIEVCGLVLSWVKALEKGRLLCYLHSSLSRAPLGVQTAGVCQQIPQALPGDPARQGALTLCSGVCRVNKEMVENTRFLLRCSGRK